MNNSNMDHHNSPRTPTSPSTTLKKDKKEESGLLDRIGTIGRKKKTKEAQDLDDEAQKFNTHNSGVTPQAAGPDTQPPDTYKLEENEERRLIERHSREDPKVRALVQTLLGWINDELADSRIIVKDMEEDLYDGQVLQKLVEKLAKLKIEVPEVTQSEIVQKQKLKIVLEVVSHILNPPPHSNPRWNVDSIHTKCLVSILHLLVALARHFRAPIRLPEYVSISIVVVQKQDGLLRTRRVTEEITSSNDDIGARFERDAFDTLFDHAPDKLSVVKKSLVTFVNKHLNKVNLEVSDLDRQFQDGVYMCMLMGLLEGYFVPLYCYHVTPADEQQKIQNVSLAFELMDDAGLPRPKARPDDIVNGDLKATLRVLYNLFTRYKNIG